MMNLFTRSFPPSGVHSLNITSQADDTERGLHDLLSSPAGRSEQEAPNINCKKTESIIVSKKKSLTRNLQIRDTENIQISKKRIKNMVIQKDANKNEMYN